MSRTVRRKKDNAYHLRKYYYYTFDSMFDGISYAPRDEWIPHPRHKAKFHGDHYANFSSSLNKIAKKIWNKKRRATDRQAVSCGFKDGWEDPPFFQDIKDNWWFV